MERSRKQKNELTKLKSEWNGRRFAKTYKLHNKLQRASDSSNNLPIWIIKDILAASDHILTGMKCHYCYYYIQWRKMPVLASSSLFYNLNIRSYICMTACRMPFKTWTHIILSTVDKSLQSKSSISALFTSYFIIPLVVFV